MITNLMPSIAYITFQTKKRYNIILNLVGDNELKIFLEESGISIVVTAIKTSFVLRSLSWIAKGDLFRISTFTQGSLVTLLNEFWPFT